MHMKYWIVLLIVLSGAGILFSKKNATKKYSWIILQVSLVIACLTIIELGIYYILSTHYIVPKIPSRILRSAFARIYYKYDRSYEQNSYDPELLYILSPGKCFTVNNYDYGPISYCINSMGLRDSEDSLKRPEIIVLGDSYAMGLGAKREQSFPKVIEAMTGYKTLDAGITSYGTARETLLFKRLDASNLKFLVIQYCSNDYDENKSYIENGFHYKPTYSEKQWKEIVGNYQSKKSRYFPFRYCLYFMKELVQASHDAGTRISREKMKALAEQQARAFVEIIDGLKLPRSVKLIITIAGTSSFTQEFLSQTKLSPPFDGALFQQCVEKELSGRGNPLLQGAVVLNTPGTLTDSDYFDIDDHMREKAHKKMAADIVHQIQGK